MWHEKRIELFFEPAAIFNRLKVNDGKVGGEDWVMNLRILRTSCLFEIELRK